ncbi:MAG: hypothetical protein IJF67_09325 [Clostridia bacterium]|nr:hypothetical protein [Clostridia bacterium]
MNAKETMTALYDIADAYAQRFAAEAAKLPPEAKIEKKALLIQRNIAGNCAGFPRMEYAGHILDTRERMVFAQNHYYKDCREQFEVLTGDAREMFLVWAHAMTMVRRCFYDKHMADLAAAEEANDVEAVFENRLICGVVGQILDDWRAWWKAHGMFDCEV